ncbi:MAG: hypothetical protein E7582_05520 [Ruminococcaceae bacterium]|nr:hypothetical protein [Oscillospiraceae bacterium]
MKKLLLLLTLFLALSLVSCDEKEKNGPTPDNKTENVGEVNPTGDKEEVKEEELYVGYVTTSYSSWRKTYSLMSTGKLNLLSERQIYGTPSTTPDGKYIFYRHTEYDSTTQDYEERLFVLNTDGKRSIITTDPKAYKIDRGGKYVVFENKEGVWYVDNFDEPNPVRIGDNIGYYDMWSMLYTGVADKSVAFMTEEGKLYHTDLDTMTTTLVCENATRLLDRVSKDRVYYIADGGLYVSINGTSELISAEYRLNSDYPAFFGANGNYHYIAKDGRLIDITNVGASHITLSPNEKYLANYASKELVVYALGEVGVEEVARYAGEFTAVEVYDDGTVIASDAKQKAFGVFENGAFKPLSECFILMKNAEYHNGKVYFILSDGSANLMRYTLGGEVELVKENANGGIFVNANGCYYITDKDSNGCGTLWLDGKSEAVRENVSAIK